MTEQDSCASALWSVREADEELVGALAAHTGLSGVVARVLAARGITTSEEARRFLEPDISRDWHDPALIPGMEAAAQVVADAIATARRIVVFGDFDLDGISSAAVAARGLGAMGADVHAIVPNRFTEGYGLTLPALERIATLGAELVITVDCGVSAAVEVEQLRRGGVDVVITDHHEPGADVPSGVAVANPKLDANCPSNGLAGAGVALKLVQAVGRLMGCPDIWLDLTDLASLGTIADIVPLTGENRALVAHGIERTRRAPRVALAALCAVAGISPEAFASDSVSYALAPRLNAPGRMSDPDIALRLLLTDDPLLAEEYAVTLDEQNRMRQHAEQDLSEAAVAVAERSFSAGDRVLVVAGEGWHEGVKGIVASRLASAFGVPAIVFAVEDGVAHGSGRSVGRVDLYSAVSGCADLLTRFGGHEAAVGVTLPASELDAFRERLVRVLAGLPAEDFRVHHWMDAELALEEVSVELVSELELLEPFGHGNPRPKFVARSVFMNGRQRVGRGADHLRFTAFDGTTSVPAIAFRCPDIEQMQQEEAAVDLAFEVVADEWRGRRRVQLHVRDLSARPRPHGYAPAADLVEDLFARAEEIIAREDYAGIEDAESFHTKLAGVTFEGRQDVLARLQAGIPLRIERQPENPHDANATALYEPHGAHVGYFNRRLAAALAPVLDAGVEYDVEVTDVTGGDDGRSRGVNVCVTRRELGHAAEEAESRLERRAALQALSPSELDAELTRAFIGEHRLHDAQVRSLEALAAGERCLTVMATGRGKSLIFHMHAARVALAGGQASVLVFPLRALVADQAFHLEEAFAGIGLSVSTLTGESSPSVRDATFSALASGELDVVMTTPEFLEHHAGRFAGTGRIGFVVVDEAHHVALSRAGHRPAYARLGSALETLGSPAVLAVTATAGTEVAATIRTVLDIETVITDPTVRENLVVEDQRDHADKDGYLVGLASRGEKTVVYVNSREQSVRLARMLRKRLPDLALRTAFYNGGLNRAARHAVERAFRSGDIVLVVSTSAFGEGVNIPDIRHVVLYHLPFNDIEFNQMCGRAGRDGASARIHALFGRKDGKVNEMVLASGAPDREDMAALYREIREIAAREGAGFEITNAELAERVARRRARSTMNDRGASSALSVFRELGFIETEGSGPYRRITMCAPPAEKVDLASSVRYAEGLEEIEEFEQFREWVLGASPEELLARFNRPILPDA